MKRFRVLNLILIALIGLATWRTVEVWRRMPPEVGDQAAPPAQPLDTVGAPGKRPALPQLVTNITDKDLFDVSRQAPSAASGPTPEQTPPPPPPTLKLAGVVFVGSQHEAVFIDISQNNKQIRMREGEEIGGYKVAKISTQQVSLVSGTGDEVKLDLLLETGKGPGPRPAGPGGVAPPPPHGNRPAQPGQVNNPPGGFGPPGGATAMQRNDARDRAQRARERLKRLREEAATNR
ncbi:hypothetical protein K2Z84_22695 [Candidatus Binatia bacterium]|nr:hypothetical protein [Candidatus Binatia bacterium]